MGWESEQENTKEPVDKAKRVWYGILICLVLMPILLWATHEEKVYNSRVKVKHILVSAPENDVSARAVALEKIQDVKRQLDEGANFEKLAKLYSDDESSNTRGGMLGWYIRKEFVKPFDDYVWIGEIDAVSDPIETSFGYHLIVVVDRTISDAEQYQLELNERMLQLNRGVSE